MSRKLSKKEGKELITKDFLYNVFKEELIEELDARWTRQAGALLEENRHHMQAMIEGIRMEIEKTKYGYDKWLSDHEDRILKLEQ